MSTIKGKVVARHVSDKELVKKAGGTYKLHSFVVEVESGNSMYPDTYAFKTSYGPSISDIRVGYIVEVDFNIESNTWKTEDKVGYRLVEDKRTGAELHKSFVSFYATNVNVVDGTDNQEEVLEHNQNFETQMWDGAKTEKDEKDDLPF